MRFLAFLLAGLLFATSCSTRPGEEECRRAIAKISEVSKVKSEDARVAADVRHCRARWSKNAVACILGQNDMQGIEGCIGTKK